MARYYRDPSASTLGKLVIFLAMIYVVVPVDLIPDVPIVGWLDDIGVMGLATAWLARVVSRYRVADLSAEAECSAAFNTASLASNAPPMSAYNVGGKAVPAIRPLSAR